MAHTDHASEAPFEILEIVDWDRRISAELRRKTNPPYRWGKFFADDNDSVGDLSCAQHGAYMRLMALALTTDNRTAWRPEWIRRRLGVSRQMVDGLSARGLVRIVTSTISSQNSTQDQQQIFPDSGDFPEALRNRSGGRGEGKGLDMNRGEGSATPGTSNGSNRLADSRTFDEIKSIVKRTAIRCKACDVETLMRLGGQSMKVTRKQCEVALDQLVADGELAMITTEGSR